MNSDATDIIDAVNRVEVIINSIAARVMSDPKDRRIEIWRASLQRVRDLVSDHSTVQIALVGTTGAGKSTLLNALIEQDILPTATMESCTAFVTTVATHDIPKWSICVRYLSQMQWKKQQEVLIGILRGEGHAEDNQTESNRLAKSAKAILAAVFDISEGAITNTFDFSRQQLPVAVNHVLGLAGPVQETFESLSDLRKYLKELVRKGSVLWPLIERVSIAGPIPNLPAGIELVDLPGTNDRNVVRVSSTRTFLQTARHIWLVTSMKRGLTQDIEALLKETRLLQKLILRGTYDSLVIVGTHADDIDNPADVGLPEDADITQICREYRLQFSRRVRTQLEELVREVAQPSDDIGTKQHLLEMAERQAVVPTSARAYLRLKKLVGGSRRVEGFQGPDDTGIPETLTHLARIARRDGVEYRYREAQSKLGEVCDELEFFFQQRGLGASRVHAQQARVELDAALDVFRTTVKSIQALARQHYNECRDTFLKSMRSLAPRALTQVASASKPWADIHWLTLQAIVRSNGVFTSPSTGRDYDLNDDVSESMLSLGPVEWENFFRFRIGDIVEKLTVQIEDHANSLVDQLATILRLATGDVGTNGSTRHLAWYKERVVSLRKRYTSVISQRVAQHRGDLLIGVYDRAVKEMQPAYQIARHESGRGMKKRMVDTLSSHATSIAKPLHDSIEADLIKNLPKIWQELEQLLSELCEEAANKAGQIVANATSHLDSVDRDTATEVELAANTLRAVRNLVNDSPCD